MRLFSARSNGVLYNGKPSQPSQRTTLDGALVLASRSEVKRGEWKHFEGGCSKSDPWARWLTNSRWFPRASQTYFHSDSQERVGRGRWSRAGKELRAVSSALWKKPS